MASETADKDSYKPEDETRAILEKGIIDEFLKNKGYTRESLKKLPPEDARRIMTEASIYASGKLTEIETKAHYRQEIKDVGSA